MVQNVVEGVTGSFFSIWNILVAENKGEDITFFQDSRDMISRTSVISKNNSFGVYRFFLRIKIMKIIGYSTIIIKERNQITVRSIHVFCVILYLFLISMKK